MRQEPRPPGRGHRGGLHLPGSPGSLRIRFRHGLPRAGSQPARDLRAEMSHAAVDQTVALAVIGGTGLYRLASLDQVETFEADTIYGAPSGPVRIGRLAGKR